ncbi:MAG: aminomethyl-transferring glycine dehydrogenase [Crocinitomicaceae bacterium]|nr:aminomethyl-transferring glycine dehydrogenase [Crocinitomicaceae bacterium]
MNFENRHIGINEEDRNEILKAIGYNSVDELVDQTVPSQIRLNKELDIDEGLSEFDYLAKIKEIGAKNIIATNFIGQGYYGTKIPSVNLRNIFENPGWYTAYTPYQAEIAQGRLEALLNFQTMVMDLTGMEIANASLLDEGTAAAETMIMFYNSRSRAQKKADVNKFFVSENCYALTKDVITGRAKSMSIDLEFGNPEEFTPSEEYFGAFIQYPDTFGDIQDPTAFINKCHEKEVLVGVAADIMALVMLKSPGSCGADAVVGNTQRFGVPMGYGGPHAAYFATREEYKRNIPGRIIGVSVDADGNQALRMALQTREQHIKRDKATSNICTAQALLAVMASMYAVYHGPKGLKKIAEEIHTKTNAVAKAISSLGLTIKNSKYFDTLTVDLGDRKSYFLANAKGVDTNVYDHKDTSLVSLSVDEVSSMEDLQNLVNLFAKETGGKADLENGAIALEGNHLRTDDILTAKVFNTYHSETRMMRYQKSLENKDLSLVHSMISLGSCTMKLNAASELIPLSMPEYAHIHPMAPKEQVEGYLEILEDLTNDLCEITGFAGMSLQPNSGAQGEYAGLMVIKAYHEANGDHHRNICLIPSSAHGTNPASAVMAGMKVVVTKCDDQGNIDIEDLRAKAEEHKDNLAALMVTYPSTHGVFEEAIIDITSIIHANGGQVYMDGANMNAQVGLTNPGNIGADVCHLNLHKTFAIPHGGGGPGMGPIGVAAHLKPFLPGNAVVDWVGGEKAIHGISAAPFGSALILLISYGYIKMLGRDGVTNSTKNAILNANYLKEKLEAHYPILYKGNNNTVAHEMILDCREFKKTAGVEVADIAKRLIDYGFHAPTVSFPVAGTLMVEPTESEDLEELKRFVDAMISIRTEIDEIETQGLDQSNNLLKNAPHTANCLLTDEWNMPYSRQRAAYPLDYLRTNKFWAPVRRVDNAYGDRNLVCSCLPLEAYASETV